MIPIERIERRIYLVRGRKVMTDWDLADIYGVTTKRLNEQVRRNRHRFPEDFVFRLSSDEVKELDSLRSHSATLKRGRGSHRKYFPHVFTEHGAVMLASVLNSAVAVAASIHVVRAFVQLRRMALVQKGLAARFRELESKVEGHDKSIRSLLDAIEDMLEAPKDPRSRIGFKP